MTIAYTRTPGTRYETDGSNALKYQVGEPKNVLILGMRHSTGTKPAGELVPILGETDGEAYFGIESQLGPVCTAFKKLNKRARLFAIGVAEDAAGSAAAGSFVFAGTVTKQTVLTVRIGARRVSALLLVNDTATQCAAKLNTAIGLVPRRMFTSLASTVTCSIACVHKGEIGNQVTIAVETKVPGIDIT